MKHISYPAGHGYDLGAHCGQFWIVTRNNGGEYAATGEDGTVRELGSAMGTRFWHPMCLIDAAPARPGTEPAVIWATDDALVGTYLKSKKKFRKEYAEKITEDTRWQDRTRIVNAALDKYRPRGRGFERCVGNDAQVAMTGSSATSMGELVMGPSRHAEVSGVKNLKEGHVVFYTRGGQARVVKLPGSNPIHLVMAPDGLTVLACCRRRAFVLDFDSG